MSKLKLLLAIFSFTIFSANSQELLDEHNKYGLERSSVEFIYSSCSLSEKIFTACVESIYQVNNLFGKSHDLVITKENISLVYSYKIYKSLYYEQYSKKKRSNNIKSFFHSNLGNTNRIISNLLRWTYSKALSPQYIGYANKVLVEELRKNSSNPHFGLRLVSPYKNKKNPYRSGLRLISYFGQTYIFDVLKSSGADISDLRPGDRILRINEKSVLFKHKALWDEELSSYYPKEISLTIDRNGKLYNKTLRTGTIVPRKYSFSNRHKKATLTIDTFESGLCKRVENDLNSINRLSRSFQLTIDLRNNYGGDVDEMLCLLGLFLGKDSLVGTLRQKNKIVEVYRTINSKIYYGLIDIKVNSRTASSSEIFVSVLDQYNRAKVYGSRTYGKFTVGFVGLQYSLEDRDSQMLGFDKIGVFYLPSGQTLEGIGFLPPNKNVNDSGIRYFDFYIQ